MDFVKCTSCHEKKAARSWIQVFGSFEAARMHGEGPEFLSSLLPGPGCLKIEICAACQVIKVCLDYSEEELKAMNDHAAQQKERNASTEKLGQMLTNIFGKKV